jgi:L-amino acid N-acyltransferase YncA/precorrin-6B methylase 2
MTPGTSPGGLERYAVAARRATAGDDCSCSESPALFGRGHYGGVDELDDLPAAASRSSMGCGNPVAVVDLEPGDTVLDLGSGGGLDVLLSARRVGPGGFVYGIDATGEMIELARRNAAEAGVTNVEFLHGDITRTPLPDASVDVVISNCVIVLAHDKHVVLSEIARVLRPGGRVGISDIVSVDPAATSLAPVDCADTASSVERYEDDLRHVGFVLVKIVLTDPLGGGLSNAIVQAIKPAVTIRPMRASDWPQVRDIYAAGIATGNATFETSAPSWEGWDRTHLPDHRLVATADDIVIGWAALSPVSDRCAYAGVAENSIYVHPDQRGRHVGTTLLDALVAEAERAGYWTIQTGIFPENTASIAVHERAGFRVIGRRERIGQLDGVWRDTLLLERRSKRL